jgi:hypothetical protein
MKLFLFTFLPHNLQYLLSVKLDIMVSGDVVGINLRQKHLVLIFDFNVPQINLSDGLGQTSIGSS